MKVRNDKIVEITDKELFQLYLDREMDDIMSYDDYKQAFINSGCEIISE